MNWIPISDKSGIKPDAWYAIIRNGKIYHGVYRELFQGSQLTEIFNRGEPNGWNITKYAEITEDNMESHIDWKPLEGLDKWPEVRDGYGIITMNIKIEHSLAIVELDTPEERRNRNHTHYAVINPPPKPERKLKPCPWCKAVPVKHENYWTVEHKDCAIEGTTIIRKGKEDLWGWEWAHTK